MSLNNIKQLERYLIRSEEWPPKGEIRILENIHKWQWFREADGTALKNSHPGGWDEDKTYLVDPLASRIAEAFADLQFGAEPDYLAGKDSDQSRLDEMVYETGFTSELQQGAEVQVSEGEVWGRCRVNKDASDWPIFETHSRANVIPLFRGVHLVACAFIDVIEQGDDAWRYVEYHTEDYIVNKLYRIDTGIALSNTLLPSYFHAGRPFGTEVPLSDLPEYADLPPVWNHKCGWLAGRVINRRGKNRRIGISQFARAQDLLYSLNEAATIGQNNMRLTARKRAVVDESVLQPTVGPDGEVVHPGATFNSQEDVLVQTGLDENLESKQGPFKILEYSFDSRAMVEWYEHLVDTILTRTRTAPALVGRHTSGAATAPAVRARLLDSTLAADSKGRHWDLRGPEFLRALQRLDALSTTEGGFDRSWSDPVAKPSITRKSILPEEPKDKMDRHATAVGAKMESRYTALQDIHPDWSEEQIKEELDRIEEDHEKFGNDVGSQNGEINRSQLPPGPDGREQRVPGAGERG